MQELRIAYRSIAWMAAIGGYLLLHYRQWLPAAGYLLGAGFAALALWSLQQLASALGTTVTRPWRWWARSVLWRYPLMLLVLWAVSRQPVSLIAGFVGGVTLLPISVGVLAIGVFYLSPFPTRKGATDAQPPSLRRRGDGGEVYPAPKAVRKSREL